MVHISLYAIIFLVDFVMNSVLSLFSNCNNFF